MYSEIAGLPFDEWESFTIPGLPAGSTIGTLINTFLIYLFPIAGFVLLAYLVYGGYQWLMSMGDPKRIQQAKDIITNSLIGFAVLMAAYWIVLIVGRVLNISAINQIFQ